jgi:hypothetical protein
LGDRAGLIDHSLEFVFVIRGRANSDFTFHGHDHDDDESAASPLSLFELLN